ncbi:unnamed protein product, partial [Urochloa humidicola]
PQISGTTSPQPNRCLPLPLGVAASSTPPPLSRRRRLPLQGTSLSSSLPPRSPPSTPGVAVPLQPRLAGTACCARPLRQYRPHLPPRSSSPAATQHPPLRHPWRAPDRPNRPQQKVKVEEAREHRKQMLELEKERLAMEQKRLQMEVAHKEKEEDERIMAINLDQCQPTQRIYYQRLQDDILQKMMYRAHGP